MPDRFSAAGIPRASHAQLAKYCFPSTITTCCVGTPENGGAIRIDEQSVSRANTLCERNLEYASTTLSTSEPTRAATLSGDGLCPVSAKCQ
jgi:hypothetical protein